jgi:AcrR family transcriptional regulator
MHRMRTSDQVTAQTHSLRSRILDASRDIVLRDGFAALSMRKIADAIGYSPASLYSHFSGRDAIAHALCAEAYEQLLAVLRSDADSANRLKHVAHAYVGFGCAHPQMYRLIFIEHPGYADAAIDRAGPSADSVRSLLGDAMNLRLPDGACLRAESLWASLHGIVALSLMCASCLETPLATLVDQALVPYLDPTEKPLRRRAPARAA